jgi:HEAT repeat protein
MRTEMSDTWKCMLRGLSLAAAAAIVWSAAGAEFSEAQTAQAPPPSKSGAKRQTPHGPVPAAVPEDQSATVAKAWKTFTDAETDKNLEKRRAALLALGNAGDRADVVKMLGRALDDEHPRVRSSAAAALGMARARTMIPQLEKALDDPAPSVRVAAARSLWQMKDYAGSPLFERIVAGEAPAEEKGVKADWQRAMVRAGDPTYMFVMGLNEGAGMLLGPYAFAIPVYRYISTDRSAPARAAVAALLGDRLTDGAVAALEKALVDNSPLVRAAAAIALGKSERPAEITQLAPLLHDRRQVVRLSAAAAVVRLSPSGSGEQ